MNDVAPRWLPGGHLQTIWPALFARRVASVPPRYQRERWDTPDGDFVDVDFLVNVGQADGIGNATRFDDALRGLFSGRFDEVPLEDHGRVDLDAVVPKLGLERPERPAFPG